MRAANARVRRARGTVPRHRSESTTPTAAEPQSGRLLRIDEAVVHDLSHELGNYFHKLYYWTDCIRSGANDVEPGTSPTDALDQTLHRLQTFLNLSLLYFEPVVAQRIAVRGADVIKAFESLLRSENPGAAIEVADTPAACEARLEIDTTRLSTAFRTIAHLLDAGPGTKLRLEADVPAGRGADRLQIVVAASGGSADAAARRAQRVVEWAVAARMLELHEGELNTNEQRPGAAQCVLTLPLAG